MKQPLIRAKHSWKFLQHGHKALQFAAVGAGTLLIALPCIADTLSPKAVQQTFEFTTDTTASQCILLTQILNLPAPETVNFRFSVAASNDMKNVFSAFTVDVADFVFQSGMPAGFKKAMLSSARVCT